MLYTFIVGPMIMAILVFIIVAILIYGVTKFVLYIFQSFGLLRIAKIEKYKVKYIVWIPGISHYVLGKFALDDSNKGVVYAILTVVKIASILCAIFINNYILFYIMLTYVIIYFVIDMIIMNKFYRKVYKKPELFTILTIVTFGLLKPIFIYTSKIKKISIY